MVRLAREKRLEEKDLVLKGLVSLEICFFTF
jgi:hypothetical protein